MTDLVFGLAFTERIAVAAKLDHDRRRVQIEGLAENIGQITGVAIWYPFPLVAMHDDARRIAASLMDVAQLDTPPVHHGRLMRLDRGLQCLVEHARGHLAHCRFEAADR